MKTACCCLFNMVLNKLFHITDGYIFSTRLNLSNKIMSKIFFLLILNEAKEMNTLCKNALNYSKNINTNVYFK